MPYRRKDIETFEAVQLPNAFNGEWISPSGTFQGQLTVVFPSKPPLTFKIEASIDGGNLQLLYIEVAPGKPAKPTDWLVIKHGAILAAENISVYSAGKFERHFETTAVVRQPDTGPEQPFNPQLVSPNDPMSY